MQEIRLKNKSSYYYEDIVSLNEIVSLNNCKKNRFFKMLNFRDKAHNRTRRKATKNLLKQHLR